MRKEGYPTLYRPRVDVRLREIEPMAYNFLLNFAKDNELEVRQGRAEAPPESG
jgi:hypothetical protein